MKNKLKGLLMISLFGLILVGCSSSPSESSATNGSDEERLEVTFQNDSGDILADSSDFLDADVREQPVGNIAVEFVFKDESKVEEMTSEIAGDKLYFYYGKELISSPNVTAPMNTKYLVVEGDFNEEKAQEIVDRINNQ